MFIDCRCKDSFLVEESVNERAAAIALSTGCGYDWCSQIPKVITQFL